MFSLRKKTSPITTNDKISRVYFLMPSYAKGGGTPCYLRLIEYLLKYTDIKAGIIDYDDGIFTRTGQKFYANEDIHYISYTDFVWDLEDNSCLVVPEDRIGYVKKISGKNVHILPYYWDTSTAWKLLFERKPFRKLSRLLYKTNACAFMDYGIYLNACKDFNQKFIETYIPLYFFHKDNDHKTHHLYKNNEINLVWLGRLTGNKVNAIINATENFYAYKTNKKKIFHIIGNGLDEEWLKNYTKQFANNIEFKFTGVLVEDELDKYLIKNADIGIAMGTSMLNFAALKIPVIGAHNQKGRSSSNKFKWLFNMYKYGLGSPCESLSIGDPDRLKDMESFDNMIDDVMKSDNRKKYGQKCYEYYKKIHANIEFVGGELIKALSRTTLTYEQLKKCFRFIPYGGGSGILTKTYKLWKIPVIKIIYHKNISRTYFCGIEIIKKTTVGGNIKWRVLFIKFSKKVWGRFNSPSTTSSKIREQCKDVYSISGRIFPSEDKNK